MTFSTSVIYTVMLAGAVIPALGADRIHQRNLRDRRNLQEFATLCAPLTDGSAATCPAASAPSCLAANSPAYCAPEHSFDALVAARTAEVQSNAAGMEASGYWFQLLEDKGAGYVLTADTGHAPPMIGCCITDPSELSTTCAASLTGAVVIKADDGHSNSGVFAFSNGVSSGTNSTEMLTQTDMTLEDVISAMSALNPTKILVEELITTAGGDLPIEYKFHMFGGEVGAIDIVMNRGTDCACYAVIDVGCERLDQQGCFQTTGEAATDDSGICTAVNGGLGMRRTGPVKQNLPICTADLEFDSCAITKLAEVAHDISLIVGSYIRVDMFMDASGKIYVQEYSTNPMNGIRYCASRIDPVTGCLDPCFLGEMWDANSSPGFELYGGNQDDIPVYLETWSSMTAEQQCSEILAATVWDDFSSGAVCTDKPTGAPTAAPVPWAISNDQADPFEPAFSLNFTMDAQGGVQSLPMSIGADGETLYPCWCLNYDPTPPPVGTEFVVTDPSTVTDALFGNPNTTYTFDIMEKMQQLISAYESGGWTATDLQFTIWQYTDNEMFATQALVDLVEGPTPPQPVGVTLMQSTDSTYQNMLCYDTTPATPGV
eukprot:CAMPEP_0194047234 /NCGR_PEP_ID=MMETSP0009_2-20130614/23637_1 /TAXON_ID=210454 /ORGANISM="Grammatophora oceanica, Strain CCMP 410" /LENGTH=600 /DNA_ID=CAMNT_0038692783 /DNA_START=31 /DNA_END=1833 /DNA_ORIENTATION=+